MTADGWGAGTSGALIQGSFPASHLYRRLRGDTPTTFGIIRTAALALRCLALAGVGRHHGSARGRGLSGGPRNQCALAFQNP